MACYHCEWKGFIESQTMRDNRVMPIILQCNGCRDTRAYSNRIQQMMNGTSAPAQMNPGEAFRAAGQGSGGHRCQIIPFPRDRARPPGVGRRTDGQYTTGKIIPFPVRK